MRKEDPDDVGVENHRQEDPANRPPEMSRMPDMAQPCASSIDREGDVENREQERGNPDR